jgi:putative oxidoreductase
MKKFLQLDFLPRSSDLALLLLRLIFGGAMLVLHGWGKLMNFSKMSATFADPLGVGTSTSLVLAIIGEVLAPALLVVGACTRLAALVCAITMGVAFFIVHSAQLSGPDSGEMSFLYLVPYVALLIAGGGRFSLDAKLGARA